MEIVDIIQKATDKIEDNKIMMNNVGNRPHYPVFTAFYGAKEKSQTCFINHIKNTWSSQICKQLLFYKYTICNSVISFFNDSNEIVEYKNIDTRISEVSRKIDIFARFDSWCFYNIIDTSELTFEEFEQAYNSLDEFKDIIDRNTHSIVIVILRDDRGNRSLNYKIRKFFQNETIYDGLVIVSNRARGGFEYEIDELYKIISNIVLMTDNDALTVIDDQFFVERNRIIYCKKPLILSYNSLSKPTHDILSCMLQNLLTEVKSRLNDDEKKNYNYRDVEQILGIRNDILYIFEDFFKDVKQKAVKELDIFNSLLYLPLKTPTVISVKDIESKQLEYLSDKIDNDALTLLVKKYCEKIIESPECKDLLNKYSDVLNANLNLLNANKISEDQIRESFEELYKRSRVPKLCGFARDYFPQLVESLLKTNYIYPHCEILAKRICNEEIIKKTKENIVLFDRNVNDQLAILNYNDIVLYYGQKMIDYLHTDAGTSRIYKILSVGNSYDDICNIVEETLYEANEYCDSEANQPFIKIYATALKLNPVKLFGHIINTLNGQGDNGILLRGSYPIDDVMSVYILHCYDRNGNNETDLYKQFKSDKNFESVHGIQFFNTGNDDSIESIKFYKCEGINLVIGLKEFDE